MSLGSIGRNLTGATACLWNNVSFFSIMMTKIERISKHKGLSRILSSNPQRLSSLSKQIEAIFRTNLAEVS